MKWKMKVFEIIWYGQILLESLSKYPVANLPHELILTEVNFHLQ